MIGYPYLEELDSSIGQDIFRLWTDRSAPCKFESTLVSVLSSSLDTFHCSEEEVLQVGLRDGEVGAGQGCGGGRTVVKILSGCLSAIEHIRRLEDLNMLPIGLHIQ